MLTQPYTMVLGVAFFKPSEEKTPPRKPRNFFTPEEIWLLKKHFPHKLNIELAAMLGRDQSTISNKAMRLGLKKTPETISRANLRKGRIQKNLRKENNV